MVKGVALEGGGSLGIAYVGAFKALEEEWGLDWDCDLQVSAGTSAGSIMASVIPACLSSDQLEGIVGDIPWEIFREGNWGYLRDLWHLWNTGGWYRNHGIVPWLEAVIRAVYPVTGPETTLDDIYEYTGTKVFIDAVDEVNGKLVRFGPDHYPQMRVVDCIMASISIPFWFPPYETGGSWFSDGGILSNHPVDALRDEGLKPADVVGFRLDGEPRLERMTRPKRPVQRAINLVKILINHARKSHVPDEYWPRIVRINTGRYLATDFKLSRAQQQHLIDCGHKAAKEWLNEQEA